MVIKEGENNFTNFSASSVGSGIISLTIPELVPGKKYTMSLADGLKGRSGVEFTDVTPIEFTASSVPTYSGNITLSQGNKITAKAEVTPAAGDTVTLIAAAYKGDKLSGVVSVSGSGEIVTPELDMSSSDKTNAWVVSEKYGVIKSTTRPERYADSFYHQAKFEKESFSLNGVYQQGDGFAADVSYTGPMRKAQAVI